MATGTGHLLMRSGKRKIGLVVIKLGVGPDVSGMTASAIKAHLPHMHVIRLVTTGALHRYIPKRYARLMTAVTVQ
jgi:hypothetical protein